MATRTRARRLTFVRWPDKTPHRLFQAADVRADMKNGDRENPPPYSPLFQSLRSVSLHPVLRAGTGESAVAVLMNGNLAGIARPGGSLAVLRRGCAARFKGVRRYIAGAVALAERLSERRRRNVHRRQHGNEGKL
jgi:hypothetical protein